MNERLEQCLERLLGNSHPGVPHFEIRQRIAVVALFAAHFNDDFPGLGELDGIADQVHQALAQALRVAEYAPRYLGFYIDDEFQALRGGLKRHGGADILDVGAQIELDGLQFQLAGFDLLRNQNVVDDGQQENRALERIVSA